MKQLRCEICNGENLVKQDGFFVCQDCGGKYTVDEIKKLVFQESDNEKADKPKQNILEKESIIEEKEEKKDNQVYKKMKYLIVVAICLIIAIVGCITFFSCSNSDCDKDVLFKDGLLAVEVNGKWGYINEKDKFVIEPQYISCTQFSEGLAAVQTEYDKWGYINKNGKFVIEPFECNSAGIFKKGIAAVNMDNEYGQHRYGFINKKGEVIVDPDYDYVDTMGDDGVARICITDSGGLSHYGFINSDGYEVVQPYSDDEFSYINPFSEGIAAARRNGNLWGYINTQGSFIIEEQFETADKFSEGLACVGIRNDEDELLYGYINTKGEIVIEPIYEFGTLFQEGKARVKIEDKWCYIDTDGNILKETDYYRVFDFSDGYARVDIADGGSDYGYINADFDIIIDCKYAYGEEFKDDGYAVVADESKKYFVIDKKGNAITKTYDRVGFLSYDFCQENDCYVSGQYLYSKDFKLYCYKHKKD